MANLFNPLADYLKPQNTTVPFAPGVAPTYAPSVPQKQKSNWLDKYVNDPSISEEGKKNLMEDIENGVLSEASADEVIKDIYREKEPGALEWFGEKTADSFSSSIESLGETGDKFASGEIGFGSAAVRGASGAMGALFSPVAGLAGQAFESSTDVETREGLKQSLAPKVGQYMEWFNALPVDQQERLRDIGAGADVVATAFGMKTGAEALKQTAKATKQAGQSIISGAKNVAQKVPGLGEPNIAKKIGQETAEAVFDNKKVLINKPERGIGEIITKPVREKSTKVLAGRAVSPRGAGMSDKQKVKLVENTEKNVRQLHKLNRTGVLKGDIGTLEDTAQTLVANLDEVGERIGKAVSELKGWPGGSQNYFKPETSAAIRSALSSKIEEAAGVANKALRDFNRLTASVKTYKDAFALKKIYQGEVKKLARSGDSSSGSFRALAQGVQDLDDALENAVARQLKWTKFEGDKSYYALMKRMIGDIAQSATVEGRRSPNTFIEQLSYLDALTSPISTAKQAFVKEISELNTRGWAWKELVKLLDEEAIGKAKLIPIKPKPTPKPSSLPTGKTDKKPLLDRALDLLPKGTPIKGGFKNNGGMTTLLPGTGKDWVEKKGAQKFTEYHGTNTDFDVFDPKKINSVEPWWDWGGNWFYFADTKKAQKYADQAVSRKWGNPHILEFELTMNKPYVIWSMDDVKKHYDLFGGEDTYYDLKDTNPQAIQDKLKSLGYDGIIDNLYGQKSVFSPDQIRRVRK